MSEVVYVTCKNEYLGWFLSTQLHGCTVIAYHGNILDAEALTSHMRDAIQHTPSIVIHNAESHDAIGCKAYNPNSTRNVLRAMTACGCKNIIYLSSADINHDIYSHYSISKLLAEHVITSWCINHKCVYIIMRVPHVIGTCGNIELDLVHTCDLFQEIQSTSAYESYTSIEAFKHAVIQNITLLSSSATASETQVMRSQRVPVSKFLTLCEQ